ncbi:hypothetical protein AAF712_001527 [Marasmius tenuissimus]|uniref:Uncharacterized protein n=1 Tax=Marasmius tenuissimus TaxID=585030 RepID=A0ABR3ACI5_9AGAR
MLQRSKDSPLFLSIDEAHYYRSPKLVQASLNQFSRTRYLRLHIADPRVLRSILQSISRKRVSGALKELILKTCSTYGDAETPFKSIAAILGNVPNLESLSLHLTPTPSPSKTSTVPQIPLNKLNNLYLATSSDGDGIGHLCRFFYALSVPFAARIKLHFPSSDSNTLECLSRMCDGRVITRLHFATICRYLSPDSPILRQCAEYEVLGHKLSVTLTPDLQVLEYIPLLASLTQLECITLEAVDASLRPPDRLLDLLDTERHPFPPRPFTHLRSLELDMWTPSSPMDPEFHPEGNKDYRSGGYYSLIVELPYSAHLALEELIDEVESVGTRFYPDHVFIVPV